MGGLGRNQPFKGAQLLLTRRIMGSANARDFRIKALRSCPFKVQPLLRGIELRSDLNGREVVGSDCECVEHISRRLEAQCKPTMVPMNKITAQPIKIDLLVSALDDLIDP